MGGDISKQNDNSNKGKPIDDPYIHVLGLDFPNIFSPAFYKPQKVFSGEIGNPSTFKETPIPGTSPSEKISNSIFGESNKTVSKSTYDDIINFFKNDPIKAGALIIGSFIIIVIGSTIIFKIIK